MVFSNFLQIIAVNIELAVMVIALVIAIRQKRSCGWWIAVTFGLFVLFDAVRLFSLPLHDAAHALIFLIACGSMLYGMWLIYEEKRPAD